MLLSQIKMDQEFTIRGGHYRATQDARRQGNLIFVQACRKNALALTGWEVTDVLGEDQHVDAV